jgi:hypothetical protein
MDSGILNEADGMEFPPVYDDIGDFLKDTENLIDVADPTQQNYFLRVDRKSVVKTQREYEDCIAKGIQLKIIPYTYACHVLKEEEAKRRAKTKARKRNKTVKAARKKNR